MSQPHALYHLQRIDLALDKRRQRLRKITTELEQNTTVQDARQVVTALEAEQRPQQARSTDLELEIQSTITQTEQLSNRLYSGKVGNPKELQDIQNKIAELKRRRSDLESKLLETMLTLDNLRDSLSTSSAFLKETESTWTDEMEAMLTEQKRLKREIKKLKIDRQAAEQDVFESNLDLYNTLRVQKKGHAVAKLDGETCTGCGVGQTSTLVQQVRHGQDVIMCPSCGRILIAL
ncbi:MAG: hypothetical protein JW966_02710 [Anaerolineae bacterium]|nr:hypothetical protein [Anaerolineae bacterium]